MATEAVAPDHTNSTDEQFEKKVEQEANNIQESVSLSNENEEKHDKADGSQGEAKTYEKKAEHAVAETEKSEDSPSSENLKEEPDTQVIGITELTPDATGIQPEEKQPMTARIPEVSVETVEELSSIDEANPTTESEAEVAKHEPAATEVHEKAEAAAGESQDKVQDAKQPNTVAVSDRSAELETIEKPHGATAKPEPVVTVTEVQEKLQDQEKESQEKPQEAEQSNTFDIPDSSPETNEIMGDAIENSEPAAVTEVEGKSEERVKESQEKAHQVALSDLSAETNEKQSHAAENPESVVTEVPEKPGEPEEVEQSNIVSLSDSNLSAETNEKKSDAIQNPEPIVTEVQEKSEETKDKSHEKPQDTEQPTTVATLDTSVETSEKLGDGIEEKTRELEFDSEASKEATKFEAGPTETEKAEPVVTEINENPGEPEKQSSEKEEQQQQKTVINQTESESSGKPVDTIEVHPERETGKSNNEAVPANEEKPELVESKEASADTVKEPILLKQEKPDKVDETSIAGDAAQAVSENQVESSPAVAGKVVQEPSTDDIKEISKEVDGVSKDPEQASINQEAKTELKKEDREYSAPIRVEEKVAASEDKKKPEEFTREAEVEIKKVEEHNETETTTTEKAGEVKKEDVLDKRAALENEKQGQPETKADEGTAAVTVTEQVKETLASKLEEKEDEPVKTGADNMEKVQTEEEPVKTEVQTAEPPNKDNIPKEIPAKRAQKQSNNILSKVKQSLVRAKKAIIGKSPPSKTEAKGDIKVK